MSQNVSPIKFSCGVWTKPYDFKLLLKRAWICKEPNGRPIA